MGFGDFYYELGIQVVEICLATNHVNGGICIIIVPVNEHFKIMYSFGTNSNIIIIVVVIVTMIIIIICLINKTFYRNYYSGWTESQTFKIEEQIPQRRHYKVFIPT